MTDDGNGADGGAGTETDERPVAVTLENRLMSHGFYVDSFAWTDDAAAAEDETPRDGVGIDLEYEAVSEAPWVTSNEVGAVLRTLLTIADEREWTPGRLDVTSFSTEGAVRGRWHVEAEWFDRLGSDLSQVEFSQRVLGTVRDRPDEHDTS